MALTEAVKLVWIIFAKARLQKNQLTLECYCRLMMMLVIDSLFILAHTANRLAHGNLGM